MLFEFFDTALPELLHFNIDTTVNNYLFHYTGYAGTVGILNSKCFLVSRSDILDDTSEIVHIKKVLKYVIKKLNKSKNEYIHDMDSSDGFFLQKIISNLSFLEQNFSNDNSIKDYDIYVLSMSEVGDSDTLYTNYSTKEGYKLKFDIEKFLDFTKPPYNYKQFCGFLTTAGRVNYRFKNQVLTILNDVLLIYRMIFSKLRELKINIIDEKIFIKIMKEVSAIICHKIHLYSMFFKKYSLHTEEEYRVAFLLDKSLEKDIVKYRNKGSREIPCIQYFFNKSALKSITLAPGNYNAMQMKSIEEILIKDSYDVEINKAIKISNPFFAYSNL